jgi:hypothetical protein
MNDEGGVNSFFGIWPGDETDEELLAMCREVRREGPRWISVRESLPNPYTIVVGLYRALGEWVEVTAAWHKDRWQPDLPVEYWMPLPELPPFREPPAN